jgi:DNA modification methylase
LVESQVDISRLSKASLYSLPERRLVTLQGNCLELMSRIKDESVDMIFCDLPYGTTRNAWDSVLPLDLLWAQYERVIKNNGAIVLTAAAPFDKVLAVSNLALFRYEWVWVKNKSTGHLNARKMPLRAHETVLVFYKKPPAYQPQMTYGHKPKNKVNPRDLSEAELTNLRNYGPAKRVATPGGSTTRYPQDVLSIAVHNNDCPDKWHPTQKPVELAEYMIRTYTMEGAVVLDNCMGSGSTGIASLNTGRAFIGIELDNGYFQKANAWLTAHAAGRA